MTNIKILNEKKFNVSKQLKSFATSLNTYTNEYENILIDISKNLPAIEKQIDNNVLEARELLNFIFSNNSGETSFGVKHELNKFHKQLKSALKSLTDSEEIDNVIFSELKKTIEISNSTIFKIKDIYNISEDLKVFAINSIVSSQKEGTRGKGYQIISGQFILQSENIAKGTDKINVLGTQLDSEIKLFLELIQEHEKFNHQHIKSVTNSSQKLMKISDSSVENFSVILNDLLNRIEFVKEPTYNIMVELQKQDIIQQQLIHLKEAMDDILHIINNKSELLESNPGDSNNESARKEYKNILTLLKFLMITTEKQMFRINKDLISMIDKLELEFSSIHNAILDVNNDKKMISQLVLPGKDADREASIIHLIFLAPENTITDILTNLEISQKQKRKLIKSFTAIYEFILSEKNMTKEFAPIIESINNLLLLARIEQARNNLKFAELSGNQNNMFSNDAFSQLSEIINGMEESHIKVKENLDRFIEAYDTQNTNYSLMEEDLGDSLSILKRTENLFTDNYQSVMDITDILYNEITQYSGLFEKLRSLHEDMNNKITICTDILNFVDEELNKLGGAVSLNENQFKDTIIQNIVEKLTVEEERITLQNEFSELDIEESTGSNITLF